MKAIKTPPDVYGHQALKRGKLSEMHTENKGVQFRVQEMKDVRVG